MRFASIFSSLFLNIMLSKHIHELHGKQPLFKSKLIYKMSLLYKWKSGVINSTVDFKSTKVYSLYDDLQQ